MARKSGRELSASERALWLKVARTATPMAKRSRQDQLRDEVAPRARPMDQFMTPRVPKPLSPELPKSALPANAPPSMGLDRRTGQRLRRGQVEADATVDLHGLTQGRAHRTLVRFIREAQARGHHMVLVITGKGKPETEPVDAFQRGRRGVLRHAVPDWLSGPELRSYVIGYQRAHQRHGGDGALYVRIRRQK